MKKEVAAGVPKTRREVYVRYRSGDWAWGLRKR